MTKKVHVEFRGLTGLVPLCSSGKKIDSYLIVLPDFRFGIADERLPNPIPPHVPVVIVPKESVVSESEKHSLMDFKCQEGPCSDREYSLYTFDGEGLALSELEQHRLDAKDDPITHTCPDDLYPKDPDEEQELQWVPRMNLANKDQTHERCVGDFDRDTFLNPDFTPRYTGDVLKLAGTLQIPAGRLYVSDVVRDDQNNPVLYQFGDPKQMSGGGSSQPRPPEWRQSLYQRIHWDAEFLGEHLDLVFTHGETSAKSHISLCAHGGRCDIWIANLELEALLGIGNQVARPKKYRDFDLDSAGFYLFSKNVPSRVQGMPVSCPPPSGLAGGDPSCKVQKFNALGTANDS